MSPGGHLVTTAAACAAAAYVSGSPAVTAAVFAGGFLIDVDHVLDYVLVERRLDLRPRVFLDYYLAGRMGKTVLVLHSYELFALLGLLAWWTTAPLLSGYLVGALLHLACDVLVNGRITPYSIGAFYCFGYRLAHRFDAHTLLGLAEPRAVPRGFWRAFFGVAPALAPLPGQGQPHPARAPGAVT